MIVERGLAGAIQQTGHACVQLDMVAKHANMASCIATFLLQQKDKDSRSKLYLSIVAILLSAVPFTTNEVAVFCCCFFHDAFSVLTMKQGSCEYQILNVFECFIWSYTLSLALH